MTVDDNKLPQTCFISETLMLSEKPYSCFSVLTRTGTKSKLTSDLVTKTTIVLSVAD